MRRLHTENERLEPTLTDDALETAWSNLFKREREAIKAVQLNDPGERVLTFDWFEISKASPTLDEEFQKDAKTVYQVGQHLLDEKVGVDMPVLLGIENVGKAFNTRVDEIRSLDGHQLVTFRALVRQKGKVEKNFRYAAYRCAKCKARVTPIEQPIVEDEFAKPNQCPQCGENAGALAIDHARSVREDMATALLAPTYDQGTDGYSEGLPLILRRDSAHDITAGDEIRVVAYIDYKQQKRKKNKFSDVAVALHAERTTVRHQGGEASEDDLDKWQRLAEREHFEQMVIQAVSPTIHGWVSHRKAMLFSLFSSQRRNNRRGDINILAVGDPGTAKSHLLRCVEKAAPRSMMVDAQNASDVGLTASVVKDELTGGWTVEAGALPMANQGVCLIDELDKADSDDIESLHESMEQQTVSVNKAGINTQIPAQASVLAAANPKHGRWDLNEPPSDQLDFTPTILSRFDAILMFKDEVDEDKDRTIAQQILKGDDNDDDNTVDVDLIRRVSWWAQQNLTVDLGPDAHNLIEDAYVELRQNLSSEDTVGISPRQLESMKRFAEARARFYLREDATIEDAKWAVELVQDWLSTIARGRSGDINVDMIEDGGKASDRELMQMIRKALEEAEETLPENQKGVEPGTIADTIDGIGLNEVKDRLKRMKNNKGGIYEPKKGQWATIS
jgi:replicative DNA helicase Mcm